MKFVSMQTLYWPGKVDHNPPETKFNKFELPTAGSNPSLIFNFESVVQIWTGIRQFSDVVQIH